MSEDLSTEHSTREPVPRDVELPALVEHVAPHALVRQPPLEALALRTNAAIARLGDAFHQVGRDARTRAQEAAAAFEAAKAASKAAKAAGDGDGLQAAADAMQLAAGALDAARRQLDETEQQLVDQQTALMRRFQTKETAQLVELGSDRLRAERDRAQAAVTDLHDQRARAQNRFDAMTRNLSERTPGKDEHEVSTLRGLLHAEEKRLDDLDAKLRAAERDLGTLRRAWRAWRFAEQNARIEARVAAGLSRLPAVYCRTDETRLQPEAGQVYFCSDACKHRRDVAEIAWGRVCAFCNRRFESSVRRVRVFEDDLNDQAEPIDVDVCSLPCWRALPVDEDEPPLSLYVNGSVKFIGPPPMTPSARARHARQIAQGAPRSETDSPLPSVASRTTRDRYREFLQQHGPATDAQASVAIDVPQATIRWVRHQNPAEFVNVGGRARGARWGVAS